jgi:hypothetical protein
VPSITIRDSKKIKSTLTKFFLAKLFKLPNKEIFFNCGKIRLIISKQSSSFNIFEKLLEINNF